MPRPTRAHISLPAIAHNLSIAKQKAGNAFVWAVTKADAYGHGLFSIYPALEQADGIALLEIENAIELRKQGEKRPILLLEGAFDLEDTIHAAQYNLTLVIHNFEQIEWLKQTSFNAPATFYLKVNTGMNRLGFPIDAFEEASARLTQLSFTKEIILMTHFANADEASGISAPLQKLSSLGWKNKVSFANSAALLGWSNYHKQGEEPGHAVRPGIALYGSSPFKDISAATLELQSTMTLEAEIISIQLLSKGEAIGYGGTFIAPNDMIVGTVSCGYADGYLRHASTGTPVKVGNYFSTLLGRVSMDMCSIDLTACPTITIGSNVELWGAHISIDTVAKHSKTIAYELMCGITNRVQKIYHPLNG